MSGFFRTALAAQLGEIVPGALQWPAPIALPADHVLLEIRINPATGARECVSMPVDRLDELLASGLPSQAQPRLSAQAYANVLSQAQEVGVASAVQRWRDQGKI